MIDVKELINNVMKGKFKVMAGQNGLGKIVETVGILEYESKEEVDDNFFKGDFVITSLFFTKDSEELADETLMRLMDNDVSAIALKTIHVDHVSDKVLDYANTKNIPIIYFDGIQFEVLIMHIVDAIRQKKNYLYYEDIIKKLLISTPSRSEVKNVALSINDSFFNKIKIVYCKEKSKSSFSRIQRIIDTLSIKREKERKGISYSVFQYDDGLLIIYTYEEELSITEKHLYGFIQSLGISDDVFDIAILYKTHKINELDRAIIKILTTYSIAKEKEQVTSFDSLGINRLLMPLEANYFARDFSNNIINQIIKYDQIKDGPLLLTAKEYIKNNGSLIECSKTMHQHVNTIRYRINKIKEITSSKDSDFYEELYFAIKFYEVNKRLK